MYPLHSYLCVIYLPQFLPFFVVYVPVELGCNIAFTLYMYFIFINQPLTFAVLGALEFGYDIMFVLVSFQPIKDYGKPNEVFSTDTFSDEELDVNSLPENTVFLVNGVAHKGKTTVRYRLINVISR